jgi:hypothetical protein
MPVHTALHLVSPGAALYQGVSRGNHIARAGTLCADTNDTKEVLCLLRRIVAAIAVTVVATCPCRPNCILSTVFAEGSRPRMHQGCRGYLAQLRALSVVVKACMWP